VALALGAGTEFNSNYSTSTFSPI